MTVEINYLAVLVAAVAAMVLGFLWYGPLFGKQWMAYMGFTKESIERAKQKGMTMTYVLQTITALVSAYVLGHLLVYTMEFTGATGLNAGLMTGAWVWLGFTAPVAMGAQMWEDKPWGLFLIQGGYYLVSFLLMGAILGTWM